MNNDEREITIQLSGEENVMKVSVYAIAKRLTAPQMANIMDEFCNCGMKDYREGEIVGKYLQSAHRTIQGSVIRFCLGVIIALSKQEYTDARNEMPVQMGKQIAAMIEDGTLKMGWMI